MPNYNRIRKLNTRLLRRTIKITGRSLFNVVIVALVLSSFLVLPTLAIGNTYQDKIDDVEIEIESKKEEESAKKEEIDAINDQLQGLIVEHQKAYADLSKIQDDVVKNQRKLNSAIQQQKQLQKILDKRAVFAYQSGKVFFLEVLLQTTDFNDFLVRLDFISRISEQDSNVLSASKDLKSNIEDRRKKLVEQKSQQNRLVNDLRLKQDKVNRLMASQQQIFMSLKGEIDNLTVDKDKLVQLKKEEEDRLARLAALGYNSSRGGINNNKGGSNPNSTPLDMLFPVPKPYAHGFSNDWNAARPGGQKHQGTDVFAARGAPLIAVTDGVIGNSFGNSNLGGYRLWLNGDNGYEFYYAHLNGDVGVAFAPGIAPGVSVSKGQVIAYMGDSGQAKGTGIHLHFGITTYGQWINPYPYLKASDWR